MIVGGVAAAVALVIVISFAVGVGGGENSSADANTGGGAPREQNEQLPARAVPAPISLEGADRPGTRPDRPAPTIDTERLARADAFHSSAKKKCNEATRVRARGEVAAAAQWMRDAWVDIEKLNSEVETYNDWYNDADFEGWEMPGAYVALGRRFAVWDKLAARVQKLKTR